MTGLVIAHRGANRLAPENTLPAFEKAYQLGATWIECDVVLTADHVPVILHDRSLWRTAKKRVYIDKLTYQDTQNYNVAEYFSNHNPHTHIPTLQSVLELAKKYHKAINIEIKPALAKDAALTAELAYRVMKSYLSTMPIIVSSFEVSALTWYRQHAPEIKLGYLLSRWQKDWLQQAKALQAVNIHCNEKILTEKRIQEIKSNGYNLWTYTVNDAMRAKQLFTMGVEGVFSDDPLLLKE